MRSGKYRPLAEVRMNMKNVRLYGKEPYRAAVIHGGPGAPGSVAAIARNLSDSYGVLEPIQTRTSLEEQVEELLEVLKEYGNLPTTLIGHSWGAWLAYIVASRYPWAVNKLILVGSAPFDVKYARNIGETRFSRLNNDEKLEFQTLIGELSDPEAEDKDNKLDRLSELVSATDNYETVKIETELKDNIKVDGNIFQSVWSEAAELRETGALIELAHCIACPVTAIHGDYDPHPAEGVEMPLHEVIPKLKFYLLEKCGHSPWKEKYAMKDFYRILVNEIENI